VAYPLALGVVCPLILEEACTLVQEECCTLALEEDYIRDPVAACIQGPAVNPTEATYRLGKYLLTILKNMGKNT
jgi:hypothetical protein